MIYEKPRELMENLIETRRIYMAIMIQASQKKKEQRLSKVYSERNIQENKRVE